MTKQEFLSMNDHSLLKPHLTKEERVKNKKDFWTHLYKGS